MTYTHNLTDFTYYIPAVLNILLYLIFIIILYRLGFSGIKNKQILVGGSKAFLISLFLVSYVSFQILYKAENAYRALNYDHKGPITVEVPTMVRINCPKCGKEFKYGVMHLNNDAPHEVNKCPWCEWVFDYVFYQKIQPMFKLMYFRENRFWKNFQSQYRSRNQKNEINWIDDKELVDAYVKNNLLTINDQPLDRIMEGYVWMVPWMQRAGKAGQEF